MMTRKADGQQNCTRLSLMIFWTTAHSVVKVSGGLLNIRIPLSGLSILPVRTRLGKLRALCPVGTIRLRLRAWFLPELQSALPG